MQWEIEESAEFVPRFVDSSRASIRLKIAFVPNKVASRRAPRP